MKKLTEKLEKSLPFWKFLSKIWNLFTNSKSFWSVSYLLIPFLISQLIAINLGDKVSNIILTFINDDTSQWSKFALELLAGYFHDAGDWVFVGVILFVIVLMVFVKLIEKEEHTRHGFFYLVVFVLLFVSILLYVLPQNSNNLKKLNQKMDTMAKDETVKIHLVEQVKKSDVQVRKLDEQVQKLKAELMAEKSKQRPSSEVIEKLYDKIIQLKLKLYALEIDDKVINKAQKIIEKEKKNGVFKALEIIKKANTNSQVEKLREQNKKQAKISHYKAGLYEWINQWKKATRAYKEAIEFDPNFDNYFDYAYFLQIKRANHNEAIKYYSLALLNTSKISKKAATLNNLALLHADDSSKRAKAEEEYTEALDIRRALAKENPKVYGYYYATTLIMGVYYFDDSLANLDEALVLLEQYDEGYMRVKWLRDMVEQLR